MSTKDINSACHASNGNRRKQGYKYFSWNCDRAFLSENKIEDLKCFAERTKCHVMSVSEVDFIRNENNKNEESKTQLSSTQIKERLKIPGYSLVLPES